MVIIEIARTACPPKPKERMIMMRFIINRSIVLASLTLILVPAFLQAEWPYDGVVVCNENGPQNTPKVVYDGAGGAIIAWTDGRDKDKKIYAQRYNGSGNPYWASGSVQ
jgi:hypothetical protein